MMKIKFLTIKKKTIIAVFMCLLCVGTFCATYFPIKSSTTPKPVHTIVIDAGHGGIDGGAEGKVSGVTESQLNLEYALSLKEVCESFGFGVVLTRSDMNGLYQPDAPNKKRSEMEKRKQIIEDSDADIVISLHMNSFPLSSTRGTQVFYGKGNELGRALAHSIQTSIIRDFPLSRKNSSVGDYFILNCHKKAGVLIECGFLSNPEEEKLLVQKDYREKMCYSILVGLIDYFQM